MEYVSPEGLRLDGRRPKELRQLKAELGVLASADGSAMFEMGNTKVLAAVFGPKPIENRSQEDEKRCLVKCEYAMASFSTGERRRRGKGDRRATEITKAIRNCLEQTILVELMPRSQIDVYVQVLQADGGTRCACINAAFMALAAAAVPMRDILASCAAGYLESTALLDLNYVEDSGGGPDVAVAIHPICAAAFKPVAPLLSNLQDSGGGPDVAVAIHPNYQDRVVLLQQDNRVAIETFEEVMQLAVAGCRAVGEFMRQQLLEHTQKLAAARAAGEQQAAAAQEDDDALDEDDY
ncbi:exosome complex component RRP41-like protein isoform A [Chlorella sorokiniana]|uniref:Exosome complex component RRP41-like protein isoform A n=1 Tax=Chlorella sorokiniana TaxID=3076 RepID=A0A2P6TCX0_CHLSO|nr:exosome complex component RRP41-like protein isoform A [Chlorella sorokiniana]|eukprot:PRW20485.1 exosome complex component RRP41-like protein isoform A [Chlorella sorokiniana]